MRGRYWLTIGALVSGTAIASTPAEPLQNAPAPVFPEESAYCQPARAIMARYFFGGRPLDVTAREARIAAQSCERTNPLGYNLSLSQIASAEGNKAEALRLGQAAVAIAPGNSEALRRICASHSDAAVAMAHCRKAVAAAPNSVLANTSMGDALRTQNLPRDALPFYDRAIAMAPNYHAARINRGVTHLNLKQYALALADFEAVDRAIGDTNVDASTVARNKADALAGLNRPTEALAVLTQRLRVASTDHWSRLRRGELLVKAGQFEAGYTECSAVMQIEATRQAAFRCRRDATNGVRGKAAADEAAKKAAREAREKSCRRSVATSTGRPIDLRLAHYAHSPGKNFFSGGNLYYTLIENQRVGVRVMVNYESQTTTPQAHRLEVEIYNDLLWGASERDKAFYNDYLRSQVLYRDKGYPLRVEFRSGGLPITIEKASSMVHLNGDFWNTNPSPQEVQSFAVARKIAESGRFSVRVWNANTGEKLLDREFVVPGFTSDRQAVAQGWENLLAANPPGQCDY